MGQIASDNVNNLAFFSRKAAITSPKIQNPSGMDTYDPSRTYVMFSMGKSSLLSLPLSLSLLSASLPLTASSSPSDSSQVTVTIFLS
jgi:hypothetical protein